MQSVLQTETGYCYLCGRSGDWAWHHVFNGNGVRELSEKYGLKIQLCPECHDRVHFKNAKERIWLKETLQGAAMEYWGMTPSEWLDIFGKNYN